MSPIVLQEKRNKYRAKPIEVNGHRFASQKEARRHSELLMLQKAGHIRNLKVHPWFVLMAPIVKGGLPNVNEGKLEGMRPVGRYTADFMYEELVGGLNWRHVIEDVKSRATKTEAYQLRKRIVEAQYGIEVREV